MGGSKREDARIQRTYTLLLQALTELLEEKPFEEIRVTDLCDRAGVHRSTFYAHFEDKHHLLTFAIQELMDIFVPQPSSAEQHTFQYALRRVFKYFLKNREMYTLLFLDPRNASAKHLFRNEYVRAFHLFMKHRYAGAPVSVVLLTTTDHSLTRIAYECGFSSQSYFSLVFKKRTGKTPGEYVKDIFSRNVF